MELTLLHRIVVVSALLLIGIANSSFAQEKKPTKVEMKGILINCNNGEKIVGAYVYLGKDKETPVTVTDSLGIFSLKCFADSVSVVSFSHTGFMPITKNFTIKKNSDVGTIQLSPDILNIDDVVVTADLPLAVQNADTTEFNPSALKLSTDADLEKLLKKLPGFEIVDGKIMVQGEEVKKMYVDGKTYFLNNPSLALKNLPASLVAKVKLYDDKSEEAKFSGYDDGVKNKSLNIVTKNPNQMKMFGTINGDYGISEKPENTFRDNKYDASISASLFDQKQRITINGTIRSSDQANTLEQAKYNGKGGKNGNNNLYFNYSSDINEKLMVTGNYSLSSSKSYSANASSQDYFPTDKYDSRIYDSENHSWNSNERHALNMRLEYKISKTDRISFTPSLSFSNGNSRSVKLANTVENADTLNNTFTKNRGGNDQFSLDGNLTWMHASKKQGRTLTTTLSVDQNQSDNTQEQNTEERFRNNENLLTDTLKNKRNTNNSNSYNVSASLSYSEPLSKNSRISANYSLNKNADNRSEESFSYMDNEFKNLIGLDTTLTNGLDLGRLNNRLGLSYNYNKDKIRFSLGGNITATQMDNEYLFLGVRDSIVKSSYCDLSPRADFNYRLSKQSTLNTSYNGNTNSPSASQLQDILDVSNPLQVSKGNPDLKKSFNHSLSVRYNTSNSKRGTFMSASVSINQSFNSVATNLRFINQDTIVNGYELQKGTRLSSPVNLNGGWGINVNSNYSFPIKPLKLVFNTSCSYRYSHAPSIYDNINTFSNSHNGNVHIMLTTNISENFDMTISSNSSFQHTTNTQTGKAKLFNESVNADIQWVFWKGFFIRSNLSYSYYVNKKAENVKQSNAMLDAEIGKKFGKKKLFQLTFSATDILRQRNSINYYLTDHYAERSYRTNANNYYSLSFSYRLIRMGSTKAIERHNKPVINGIIPSSGSYGNSVIRIY